MSGAQDWEKDRIFFIIIIRTQPLDYREVVTIFTGNYGSRLDKASYTPAGMGVIRE